jgi:hypothetical protein
LINIFSIITYLHFKIFGGLVIFSIFKKNKFSKIEFPSILNNAAKQLTGDAVHNLQSEEKKWELIISLDGKRFRSNK